MKDLTLTLHLVSERKVLPTWLESYGSSLRDGKNKKNISSSCEASDFRGRSQTDFLHDLEARLSRPWPCTMHAPHHLLDQLSRGESGWSLLLHTQYAPMQHNIAAVLISITEHNIAMDG